RNGLRVVLSERHTTPTVAIAVYYDVGSRNEERGRSGFAHLFEHMMFEGSENVGKTEHFKLIARHGGVMNGNTTVDRTAYFEVLPANQLPLGLWLEADRMRALAVTRENFENQRETVKEERRMRYDNRPYNNALNRINEIAYDIWEYAHPTIGSMADLDAADLHDVQAFHRTYYIPNNAVLAIVGDFDPKGALALARDFFEGIPRGETPPSVSLIEPPHTAPRRESFFDPHARLPALFCEFNIPPMRHPDHIALGVVGRLLFSGESSRLYRRLVKEKALAVEVEGGTDGRRGPDLFTIEVFSNGTPLSEIEPWIAEELERLKVERVGEEELAKIRNQIEAEFAFRGESNLESAQLLAQTTLYYGDPEIVNLDLARMLAVTPADIERVARTWFVGRSVSILEVHPAPARPLPPVVRQRPIAPPLAAIPFPDEEQGTLENGLEVVATKLSGVPTLALSLTFLGGTKYDPPGREGLARLVGTLLEEGTPTRSSRQIAEGIERIGARFEVTPFEDATELTLHILPTHLSVALEILTDVVRNAAFPPEEVEKARRRELATLENRLGDPRFLAETQLFHVLFGTHPYAVIAPTPDALRRIGQSDLVAYRDRFFVPGSAILAATGGIEPAAFFRTIERFFGDWVSGEGLHSPFPKPTPIETRRIWLIDRPESVQSTIFLGNVALPRNDPDHLALTVANHILGGGTTGRLFLRLREEKGYTYGAYSRLLPRSEGGPWIASADVRTEVTGAALEEILDILAHVPPISEEELEAAKAYLTGVFPIRIERPLAMAQMIARRRVYRLPDDEWRTYHHRISTLDRATIERVAGEHFVPERVAIVVVGNARRIEGELAAIAPVVRVDPDAVGR
ncbi:MAG: insulinase family protein, partial [Deltaproteobacteria bacterium]